MAAAGAAGAFNTAGFLKEVIRAADSGARPTKGERATVHHVCRLGGADGKVIDSSRDRGQPLTFTLGRDEVIPAWEQGVATMAVGEVAVFTVQAEAAYGAAGCFGGAVPPGAVLHFELELLAIVAPDDEDGGNPADRSPEERLDIAMREKDGGNAAFKAAELQRALTAYQRALRALGLADVGNAGSAEQRQYDEEIAWSDGPRRELRDKLALACHLNAAQCCLRLESAKEAMEHATAALELEPGNAKALYRRGSAAILAGHFARARGDLSEAARREPRNAEIRAQLQRCTEQARSADRQSQGTFKRMIGQ